MKQEVINRIESITRDVDIAAKCLATMIEDCPIKTMWMTSLDQGLEIIINALNGVLSYTPPKADTSVEKPAE